MTRQCINNVYLIKRSSERFCIYERRTEVTNARGSGAHDILDDDHTCVTTFAWVGVGNENMGGLTQEMLRNSMANEENAWTKKCGEQLGT